MSLSSLPSAPGAPCGQSGIESFISARNRREKEKSMASAKRAFMAGPSWFIRHRNIGGALSGQGRKSGDVCGEEFLTTKSMTRWVRGPGPGVWTFLPRTAPAQPGQSRQTDDQHPAHRPDATVGRVRKEMQGGG